MDPTGRDLPPSQLGQRSLGILRQDGVDGVISSIVRREVDGCRIGVKARHPRQDPRRGVEKEKEMIGVSKERLNAQVDPTGKDLPE